MMTCHQHFTKTQAAIGKLAQRQDLTRAEARSVAEALFAGEFHDAQLGCLMMGLRIKGETADELVGLLSVYQEHTTFNAPEQIGHSLLDLCGTGGDGPSADVFNVSTTSMFVAAAGGVRIAKHGTSAVSSQSGSTEVLKELGVPLRVTQEEIVAMLERHGMCYIHGPLFNKAMANVIGARRQTGMRSIFNLLGPLSNPLKPTLQLVGIYDVDLLDTVVKALQLIGRERAMVVCAEDGLDELSVVVPTHVRELKNGVVNAYTLDPRDFFGRVGAYENIVGGAPAQNARIAEAILKGELDGDARNIVVFNAGAALYLVSRADSLEKGIRLAFDTIVSGRAFAKLEELRAAAKFA